MDQRDPESLFSAWAEEAERLGPDAAPDFEALLAAHPDHAAVLRRMHADWLHFAPLLARVVPGLMASEMGLGDAPLPSGADDAPQPVTPELLDRLGIQVPDSGRYRFRGVLGQGGGGVVLRVWDQKLQRSLAMKVVLGASELRAGQPRAGQGTPPIDAAVLTRFVDEARIASQLDHPSIVPVHELGTDATGRAYFTMRLVRGQDLHRILEARRNGDPEWSETRLLGLLAKACEAVAYAHERGVVHRDLKPSNIMVGRHGEVHVMDWGLARVLVRDAAARAASAAAAPRPREPQRSEVRSIRRAEREATPGSPLLTGVGAALGTPAYMAPEQARGEHDRVDARADVYALGAILYELLGGTPPFVPAGANVDAGLIYLRLLEGPPRPIRELAPRAPEQLIAITERAMARDASERYPDVRALETDLRAFLERRVVRAYRTGAWAETGQWIRRNPVLASSLGALLLVVMGFTLVLAERGRELRQRGDEAIAAQEQERRAKEELLSETYSAAIFRSGVALERGELRSAREWLAAAPRTCRDWEWGYLDNVLNRDMLMITEPGTALNHAVFSPDGNSIASLGDDDIVRAYDSSNGRCVMQSRAVIENAGSEFSLQYSPDGQRLIVSESGLFGYSTSHWVLNSGTGSLIGFLKSDYLVGPTATSSPEFRDSNDGRARSILYNHDSDSFIHYTFGADLALHVLDGRGLKFAQLPLPGLNATPCFVQLSRNRSYLAIHDGRELSVWDLRSMSCIARVEFGFDTAFGRDLIRFGPDERSLVVFDSSHCELMTFELGSPGRRTVLTWDHEQWSPGDLCFSHDGLSVIAIGYRWINSSHRYGVAGWNLLAPTPAQVFNFEAVNNGYAYEYTRFFACETSSRVLLSTGMSLLSLDASRNFEPSALVESFQLDNRADAVGVASLDTSKSFALDDDSRVWTLQGRPTSFSLGGPRPHDEGYVSTLHTATRQVCATCKDGILRVWRLDEFVTPLRHALANIGSDSDGVCYVSGTRAALAVILESDSKPSEIGIFDGVTGALQHRLQCNNAWGIYFNLDAKRLLTCGSKIQLWDTESWTCVATIPSGVVTPNTIGRRYFVIERGGKFSVHRLSDGSVVHESFTGRHMSDTVSQHHKLLAVIPGDIALLYSSAGSYLGLDLEALQPIALNGLGLEVHGDPGTGSVSQRFFSLGAEKVLLWDARGSGQVVNGVQSTLYSPLHLTDDGRLLLGCKGATNNQVVVQVDVKTNATIGAYSTLTSDVAALTLSPDRNRVVAVTEDGMLQVWDAASAKQLLRVRVSTTGVIDSSVQFSADGRTLLVRNGGESTLLLLSSIGASPNHQSGSR